MKDKILVWMPREYYYFGIAKYLADIYDCDIYAITDAWKNEKTFLENQKFLNIKKIFYYRDAVKINNNKKPDLNYLKSFEEKYGINLWQLAYSERLFYKFNPYYNYKKDEILTIIEQECIFFEKIIDEIHPNFLLIKLTDSHTSHLLAKLSELKQVERLVLGPGRFSSQIQFYGDVDSMSTILYPKEPPLYLNKEDTLESILEKKDSLKMISEYRDKLSSLSSLSKRIERFYNILTLLGDRNYRNHYFYYNVTRTRFLKKRLSLKIERLRTNYFVKNNLSINWTEEETPFVYYPLHSEPERAISIAAPYYTNQLEIITHIAKSLPINYRLFVKDHPIMDLKGGRTVSFYKEIQKLPNVKLLHHNTDRKKILKKCSLVITITGTTGLEAAFYNKPTITFGKTPYSKLSWIYRVTDLEDLPTIIRRAIESKIDIDELRKYISYMDYNSFNVDLNSVIASFGVHFQNNEINEKDILEVLDENKKDLQKIADLYVNKIQEIKKMN